VHASRQYHNQLIAALTLSVLISYADRTNMSLTVLEMMRELGLVDPKTNIVEPDKEGILLAAFFCGYIVTQVPGGWAAQVWGGRRVLAIGSVVWSVCTFLIPLATTAGFWWVVLLRVGLGLGEGVCFPSIHVLVSRWVPESEKSRAVAIITAGAYLGNIVAIGVSGELIRSPYFGWRYAFYIFGIFGLVWNFGWHVFARHEHEHHNASGDGAAKETASDAGDDVLPPDDVHASVVDLAPRPRRAAAPRHASAAGDRRAGGRVDADRRGSAHSGRCRREWSRRAVVSDARRRHEGAVEEAAAESERVCDSGQLFLLLVGASMCW
jgi:hypothetical protein